LEQKYADSIQWMKLSEIAGYWGTKKYITFNQVQEGIEIYSPFADLSIRIDKRLAKAFLIHGGESIPMNETQVANSLNSNSYDNNKGISTAYFNLQKGKSILKGI